MFSKHQRELFTHDSHVLRQWQTHRWITNTSLVSVVYRLTCIRQTSLCWMWVYCEEFKAFSFHTNLQTETKHSVWHLRGSPGNMNYYVQPSRTSGIDLVPRCKHKDDKQRKRQTRFSLLNVCLLRVNVLRQRLFTVLFCLFSSDASAWVSTRLHSLRATTPGPGGRFLLVDGRYKRLFCSCWMLKHVWVCCHAVTVKVFYSLWCDW